MGKRGSTAILATKKLARVAPEVNLDKSLSKVTKYAKEGIHFGFENQGRNPNPEVQNSCPSQRTDGFKQILITHSSRMHTVRYSDRLGGEVSASCTPPLPLVDRNLDTHL